MFKFFRRIRQQLLSDNPPDPSIRAEVDRVLELNATYLKHTQGVAPYTGPELPDIAEQEVARLFFGTINSVAK